MSSVFLLSFRSVLVRNSAVSIRLSRERHFLVHSWTGRSTWKKRWSVAYLPCSLVSNQIDHRSTSFSIQYTIESVMVYSKFGQHQPVMRNCRRIGANQKRRNILKWLIIFVSVVCNCYLSINSPLIIILIILLQLISLSTSLVFLCDIYHCNYGCVGTTCLRTVKFRK